MIVKITKKYLKQTIKKIIKEGWEDLPAGYKKGYGGMAPEKELDMFGEEDPSLTSKEYMDLEDVEQQILQHARTFYPEDLDDTQRNNLELDVEKDVEILAKITAEEPENTRLLQMALDDIEMVVMVKARKVKEDGVRY